MRKITRYGSVFIELLNNENFNRIKYNIMGIEIKLCLPYKPKLFMRRKYNGIYDSLFIYYYNRKKENKTIYIKIKNNDKKFLTT